MSYIRSKEIPPGSGNFYDYEVKCVWVNGKPVQKHIRYIGKSGRSASALSGGSATPVSVNVSSATQTSTAPDPRITKMKTPSRKIASALGMYYGGMPLDAIQQQFRQDHDLDMSESNYWNWVKRFTKEAIRQSKDFKPEVGSVWVADETYMKLGKRNIYFWDIIDADTRYILATHVSFTRGTRDAEKLMVKARERAGKAPSKIYTDKLRSYLDGIELTFGADTEHRQGSPFNIEDNTNLIERFHRTLKQRAKVFQKFKNIEDIRLLTDGWLINYNFFKQHEGIGDIPPAQAKTKVVPFKDWNDIIRDDSLPDIDYKVSLHPRKSRIKAKPVTDAILTPLTAK